MSGLVADARAVAAFVPDCAVLIKRLLGDPRVPRRRKLVAALAVPYLAMPLDVIPDFLPVIGLLDDALVVALARRYLLRSGGSALLAEHGPGPPRALAVVERLSGAALTLTTACARR